MANLIRLEHTFFASHPADQFVHIEEITGHRIDVGLKRPFVIHDSSVSKVTNAAVRLKLASGITGWGEVPVLPAVLPQTQQMLLDDIKQVAPFFSGEQGYSMLDWEHLLKGALPGYPALRAGLEVAYYDALCRSFGKPMHVMFGGSDAAIKSDITIPICGADEAKRLAAEYATEGFETIKIKVGSDVDDGISRMRAIRSGFPGANFIVDANQAFDSGAALAFLNEVRKAGLIDSLLLFEQPVHRDDRDGLSAVSREGGVLVAADESVRNLADAEDIINYRRAPVINIKLAKLGLVESARIVFLAQANGVKLMMGGMVETNLGMATAAMFAVGMGGFDFFDVDTSRLLETDPIIGGPKLTGATYNISGKEAGHGMSLSV